MSVVHSQISQQMVSGVVSSAVAYGDLGLRSVVGHPTGSLEATMARVTSPATALAN